MSAWLPDLFHLAPKEPRVCGCAHTKCTGRDSTVCQFGDLKAAQNEASLVFHGWKIYTRSGNTVVTAS